MTPVEVTEGAGPVVLAMPHTGTWVPAEVGKLLNAEGRKLRDTDWHIDRLYSGLLDDVTVVRATFHRYVIDANRDPGGASLYPGQNTTGLVPATDFDGQPIWDRPVTEDEVASRRQAFHAPYHAALRQQVDRVRARHGVAVLYDCHSIRSEVPFLFDGLLQVFNIGTFDGRSCAGALQDVVAGGVSDPADARLGFDAVLNQRFKGGWTTRHYGRPEEGVHAVQMELAQRAYLKTEAAPWHYDTGKADALRAVLGKILRDIREIAPELKVTP